MTTAASERDPFDTVAEDFLARWRAGGQPSVTEYVQRYPDLANQIRELFPALVLMEQHRPTGNAATSIAELWRGSAVPDELGEYRLLREVGRGGMGVVYEAVQMSLQRHVALKVLPPHRLRGPEHLERFRREARIAAGLHHTNIVPVFGVGEHEGVHYYAMQFIRGQGIDEVLREVIALRKQRGDEVGTSPAHTDPAATIAASMVNGRFADACGSLEFSVANLNQAGEETSEISSPTPRSSSLTARPSPLTAESASDTGLTTPSRWQYWRSVAEIGLQVAEALDYAHRQGVLHRDVKPSNLLLDLAGRVWITDFGLAKADDSGDLTEPDQLVGTIRYMSPERFQGRVDKGSDIYSLGVTLYEMLTLCPAFEGVQRAEVMERVLRAEPVPPRKLDRRVPRDLETVVLKAMAKERRDRYAEAADLAADLRRFLADQPIRARRPALWERGLRWCRRNPAVAALSAALAAVLVLLTVGTLIKNAQLSTALSDSETANRAANAKLWESLRDRARAMRMSQHAGQRIESLRSIAEAMRLPLPPGHSLAELRTEAVAALALPDFELEREWQGGLTPGIIGVAFDPKLERYARLAQDGTVSVHCVGDDHVVARWKEATQGAWPYDDRNLQFSPDGSYVSVWHSGSKRLVIRKLAVPEPIVCYRNETSSNAWSAAFSLDGTTLAHVMPDSRIAVVDLASGQARYLPPTGEKQGCIEFAPDGRRFAICVVRAGKFTVEVRDLATGNVQASLPHPRGAGAYSGWNPDGRTLATTCEDRMIRLWDVPSGNTSRTLRFHKAATGSSLRCSFDSTGQLLLSNDWDGVLRLWEPLSGRQLLSFPTGGYALLRVSPDNRLASYKLGDSTKLQLLRLHGRLEYRTITAGDSTDEIGCTNSHMVVHPGGRLVAIRTDMDSTVLLDLVTGRKVADLRTALTRPLLWEDSGALLTCGRSGLLRWALHIDAGPPEVYRFGPPERLLASGSLDVWGASADGQTIALPNYNAGAVVVNHGQAQRTVRLQPQEDVRYCAVSPDGRWVATGSHSNTDMFAAKVWEAATGRPVKALPVPGLCNVCFSPDGRWLLTTAGGCRLWAVGTWAEGPTVGGATGCFSPEGKLVAVEDSAGALRLVETETGREVVRLEAPEQTRLMPGSFTPDGTSLIAVGVDTQAVHIWDLRGLRQGLAELGLDWVAPPYPPATKPATGPAPLTVTVDMGNLLQSSKAEELVAQANRQERAHAYGKAIATLRQALAACPDHATANNNLAWLLLTCPKEHRDPKAALPLAQKAVSLATEPADKQQVGIYENTLGVALYRAGRFAEAVPILESSLRDIPGLADAHNLLFLAMCHARLGEVDKAKECYEGAKRWRNEKSGSLQPGWAEELDEFQAEADALLKAKSPQKK
jgi:serine/threonine protein kinase/WD40 repeat protein/Tfp pilus assembly protein PilF